MTLGATLRDGSLRKVAWRRGARVLLFEAGEPLRFDRDAIESGVAGVLRVLAALGMVDPALAPPPAAPTRYSRSSRWARAPRSGLFHLERPVGEHVERGESVGFLTTPYDDRRTKVKSPATGVVIGATTNPLVFQGDALAHVAEL